ncbi:hypothetical protein FKM82_007852 [Ascaphus truei]
MAEADKNVPEMELSMGSASREDLATQNKEKDEPTILEKYVQPCLAELLGSTLFFSVGCLSVLINPHGAGPLMPALAHGFTLAALISVLGNISGGHFNPVITLAVVISGGLTPVLLVPYWICQLSGGILGALLAKGLADEASFVNRTGAACMVDSGSSVVRAVGVEMSLTCLLILTVLMGALGDRSKTPLAPFSIAFTLVAGILAGIDGFGCPFHGEERRGTMKWSDVRLECDSADLLQRFHIRVLSEPSSSFGSCGGVLLLG